MIQEFEAVIRKAEGVNVAYVEPPFDVEERLIEVRRKNSC